MAKNLDLSFQRACQIVNGRYPELENDIRQIASIFLGAGVVLTAGPVAVASGQTTLTAAAIYLTAVATFSKFFGIKNEILSISGRLICIST